MGEILGRVMTVAGSQVTVNPEADLGDEGLFRIGAMVKVGNGDREVVATISAVRFESNSPSKPILVADLLGEIVPSDGGRPYPSSTDRLHDSRRTYWTSVFLVHDYPVRAGPGHSRLPRGRGDPRPAKGPHSCPVVPDRISWPRSDASIPRVRARG